MSFTLFYKRPILEKKDNSGMPNFPGRFNNYKNPTNKSGLENYINPTPKSREHHQTVDRITGSNSNRKHLNFVPRSHGAQLINHSVERFIKSGQQRERIGNGVARQILIQYHRPPNPQEWDKSFIRLGKSEASIWFDGNNFWFIRNQKSS